MLVFKDINSWSKSKVWLITILFWILYFLFATIGPCISVGVNYRIFSNYTGVRLTGWGWIILVIFLTAGLKVLFRLVKKLPEYTRGEQLTKFIIEMIGGLFVPALILVGIHLVRVNAETALNTLKWAVISYMVAIVIDNIFVKPLCVQIDLIKEHEKKNAVESTNV